MGQLDVNSAIRYWSIVDRGDKNSRVDALDYVLVSLALTRRAANLAVFINDPWAMRRLSPWPSK
jgi:hypothetical protein